MSPFQILVEVLGDPLGRDIVLAVDGEGEPRVERDPAVEKLVNQPPRAEAPLAIFGCPEVIVEGAMLHHSTFQNNLFKFRLRPNYYPLNASWYVYPKNVYGITFIIKEKIVRHRIILFSNIVV